MSAMFSRPLFFLFIFHFPFFFLLRRFYVSFLVERDAEERRKICYFNALISDGSEGETNKGGEEGLLHRLGWTGHLTAF